MKKQNQKNVAFNEAQRKEQAKAKLVSEEQDAIEAQNAIDEQERIEKEEAEANEPLTTQEKFDALILPSKGANKAVTVAQENEVIPTVSTSGSFDGFPGGLGSGAIQVQKFPNPNIGDGTPLSVIDMKLEKFTEEQKKDSEAKSSEDKKEPDNK